MLSAPSKPRSPSGPTPSSRERSLVPIGMATILPHATKQVRRLERDFLDEVGRWGYEEIILPTFEYLDVLAPGLEAELVEKCYKLADRTTGRMLVLRPDATAQIARTVAMGLTGSTLPLRLSYRTSVFRHQPEHAGRDREILQVGAELIGVDDGAGDSEIISLLIECLRAIGLRSFTVSVGHVGFSKGLLVRAGLSAQGQKRAEQAVARKDLPRLEEILAGERVSKALTAAILEAPELYGREEVLERGRVLAGGDPTLQGPLDRLAQVYQLLCAAGYQESLLLDLGEFRGFDYYDGVVFDVFAEGVGAELGGGGRYDHLLGRFGRPLPSTGFALDVDRLFHAVTNGNGDEESLKAEYLVAAPRRAARRVMAVASQLRRVKSRVIQYLVKGADDKLLADAVAMGVAQRAAAAVVVGAPGTEQDEVVVVDLPIKKVGRPRTKTMKLKDLVSLARRYRRGGKEPS
jgi:ATP phosphoribosyltransferase regulatory subunit